MEYIPFEPSQAIMRNDLLGRRHLSSNEASGRVNIENIEAVGDLAFFRIKGLTRFWASNDKFNLPSIMSDVLTGIMRYKITFGFIILGDATGISVYAGVSRSFSGEILTSLSTSYPGIDLEESFDQNLLRKNCVFGGILTGYPSNKTDDEGTVFQIENICKGMVGKNWAFLVLARGMSTTQTNLAQDKLLNEMKTVNDFIRTSITGGPMGNQTKQTVDLNCQNYLTNMRTMEKIIKDGSIHGMWRVNGYYAAQTQNDADKLRNIMKSAYSGKDSAPEVFRCLPYDHIGDLMGNFNMAADLESRANYHPVGVWTGLNSQKNVDLCKYQFQTVMNSRQLATLCQLPTKEIPGFYIDDFVEFDNSNRTSIAHEKELQIGDIMFSGRNATKIMNNQYQIDLNDLTRHALIIGITGGGKTNTSKSILSALWTKHRKPFLVIESAKREYWEMANLEGFEDLVVYTLGSEITGESVKYRINPFEVVGQVSLQTHIDYLLSTFKASFELYAPMPYVLETAVYEVYSDRGWDIVENSNMYGRTEYPTLTDLYHKIDIVTDRLGYHNEIQSNVKAALKTRINSLRIGGKGAMLDTPVSVPIQSILTKPTILELEDLGDDDTKAFVIGILLVQLYEYRKSNLSGGDNPLQHVLLVEEAHRLLKHVPMSGEGSNTRAKSVEFFCNLLAEIRSFGQGIFIADQIPTKLASDTLKNTNLKIIHRTVMQEDREAVGKSMNMTQEQIDYLSSLRRGFAAIYAEGDSRPKLVKMPLVVNKYNYDRETVLDKIRDNLQLANGAYDVKYNIHAGCAFCDNRCQNKAGTEVFMERLNRDTVINKFLPILVKYQYRPKTIEAMLECITAGDAPLSIAKKICILGQAFSFIDMSESRKTQLVVDYIKHSYGGA